MFKRKMLLSVSDKNPRPQVYRFATQGARNSVPSPRRDFCGLSRGVVLKKEVWERRSQGHSQGGQFPPPIPKSCIKNYG